MSVNWFVFLRVTVCVRACVYAGGGGCGCGGSQDGDGGADGGGWVHAAGGALRALCFQRLSDLFLAFPDHDFSFLTPLLAPCFDRTLASLPSSMLTARKPSALLKLMEVMSLCPSTAAHLTDYPRAIPAVLDCIGVGLAAPVSAGARSVAPAVLTCVYKFVENLLALDTTLVDPLARRRHEFDGTKPQARPQDVPSEPLQLLRPFVPLLLEVRAPGPLS